MSCARAASPSCPLTTWARTISGPRIAPSASTSPGTWRIPTLWRLVNDHLFEYSREEVLMYLRHEAGHAINYAFELWRRRDWTQTFGDFRRQYRDVYNPNPWSRDYVRYLHRAGMYHYAQKHPDEDWAETFAVWLDPDSHWRRRYRDWQVAFAKLEYVDRIVELEGACRGSPSNVRLGLRVPYTDMRETVAEYFDIGDVVDKDLMEYRKDLQDIFVRRPPRSRRSRAAQPHAHRQRAVGRALHPAAPADPGRPALALDRRLRQARDPALPAPVAGPVHPRAPGGPRQPPHREAGRADRRRHLARRRRHPPTELTAAPNRPRAMRDVDTVAASLYKTRVSPARMAELGRRTSLRC